MAQSLKIDVRIDDADLKIFFLTAPTDVRRQGWAAVRKISLLVEGIVKRNTPVDSGRARASWGHWSPGDFRDAAKAVARGASAADAGWEEDEANSEIAQGSNVEYFKALNEGHSQQMGAGFVDDAAQEGAYQLINELERIMNGIFK